MTGLWRTRSALNRVCLYHDLVIPLLKGHLTSAVPADIIRRPLCSECGVFALGRGWLAEMEGLYGPRPIF